ncbi:hypothetical protein ACFSJY_12605 [Thalassotalea euphylliae]|uniref:hypothetical protein n=1 Tax=Thalassotalea euphylliae TaxID=1655234 RepID=UPI003624E680
MSIGVITVGAIAMVVLAVFFVISSPKIPQGQQPMTVIGFVALLFTAGLDGGLIFLPLQDFKAMKLAQWPAFVSFHPLAVEFAFWGPLVWLSYFVATAYFCFLEPRLGLFNKPAVKCIHGVLILTTAAFTLSLFWQYLPAYLPETLTSKTTGNVNERGNSWLEVLLIFTVIVTAVAASFSIKYITKLSQVSMYLFGMIMFLLLAIASPNLNQFTDLAEGLTDFFANAYGFITPLNDYHAFYLAWWFSWSIMMGQFMAKFVASMSIARLFVVMMFMPCLPILGWLAACYLFVENASNMPEWLSIALVVIAALFVINSLDFMINRYAENLSVNIERLGRKQYLSLHTVLLLIVTILFYQQVMLIEWIGAFVITILILAILIGLTDRYVLKKGYINELIRKVELIKLR